MQPLFSKCDTEERRNYNFSSPWASGNHRSGTSETSKAKPLCVCRRFKQVVQSVIVVLKLSKSGLPSFCVSSLKQFSTCVRQCSVKQCVVCLCDQKKSTNGMCFSVLLNGFTSTTHSMLPLISNPHRSAKPKIFFISFPQMLSIHLTRC